MEWCLLITPLTSKDGIGPVLDEERGCKRVPSEDGQVEKTVSLGVLDVKVALVRHQGVGNPFVPIQQCQVEGDVPIIIALIKLLW